MAISPSDIFTTKEGIKETIQNDPFTFRWFCHLMKQSVMKEYIFQNKEMRQHYQSFMAMIWLQWLLDIIVITFAFVFLIEPHWGFVLGFLFSLFCRVKLRRYYKRRISNVGLYLIEREFTEEKMKRETFFYICETLAERAKTFSLVDAIYHQDKIYRFMVIFGILLVGYIFGIESWWKRYGYIIILYTVVHFMSNADYFYRKIR